MIGPACCVLFMMLLKAFVRGDCLAFISRYIFILAYNVCMAFPYRPVLIAIFLQSTFLISLRVD